MKKRVLAIVLVLALCMSCLTACGAKEKDTYTVGVCQLLQHAALDAATQGFKDALTEKLGDKVKFDVQNAAGESANCATIVNGFVSSNVDLIMANATPALQAAAAATATIPVLGTSVTDYASALDITNWNGTVGTNVSGTSDLAPLDAQADMFAELLPSAKTVGLIYCSAESNSVYQVKTIKSYLEAKGITCKDYGFSDSNDIASVVTNAVAECDALFVPTDNTAADATSVIDNIALPAGVPIIASEAGICAGCGIATLSISYYDLGYATGLMAYDILTGAKNVKDMPVQTAPNVTKQYVPSRCTELGITVPSSYVAIEE